jgi:hypothetical protein
MVYKRKSGNFVVGFNLPHMKKIIYLLLLASPILAAAQDLPYQFTVDKESKIVHLTHESSHVRMPFTYAPTPDGEVKYVKIDSAHYQFRIRETTLGKVKEVIDSNKNVIATMKLKGQGKGNIYLPTGEVLQTKVANDHWAYYLEGKEVIGVYRFEMNYKSYLQIIKYDALLPKSDAIKILALDPGIRKLQPKNMVAPYIITGVLLGVIRVVASPDSF